MERSVSSAPGGANSPKADQVSGSVASTAAAEAASPLAQTAYRRRARMRSALAGASSDHGSCGGRRNAPRDPVPRISPSVAA